MQRAKTITFALLKSGAVLCLWVCLLMLWMGALTLLVEITPAMRDSTADSNIAARLIIDILTIMGTLGWFVGLVILPWTAHRFASGAINDSIAYVAAVRRKKEQPSE